MRAPIRSAQAIFITLVCSCSAQEDIVFRDIELSFTRSISEVNESDERASIGLKLSHASVHDVRVEYQLRATTAADHERCRAPDFSDSTEALTIPAGETSAFIDVDLLDDNRPEANETLHIEIGAVSGAQISGSAIHQVTIIDDDVGQIHPISPPSSSSTDATARLQAVFNEAEPGDVVLLAPGEYVTGPLLLPLGVSLSGYGATLIAQADLPENANLVSYADSITDEMIEMTIQGLSLQAETTSLINFIQVEHHPNKEIRFPLIIEDVRFARVGLDAIDLGANLDARICDVTGESIMKGLVTLGAGASSVEVRGAVTSGEPERSGMYFGAAEPGYGDDYRFNLVLEDVELAHGDLEIWLTEGSELVASRITMHQGPFAFGGGGARARISDSTLYAGPPGGRHSTFFAPTDLIIEDSTIILTDTLRTDGLGAEPRDPASVVNIDYRSAPEHQTQFQTVWNDARFVMRNCRLESADDVEASTLFGVTAFGEGEKNQVTVEDAQLSPEVSTLLSDDCQGCVAK